MADLIIVQPTRNLEDVFEQLVFEYSYVARVKTYIFVSVDKFGLYGHSVSAPLVLYLVQGWECIEYSTIADAVDNYNIRITRNKQQKTW